MVSSLFATVPAHALTQGTLGTTSTGVITITATIPGLVQISGLTDLSFTTLDGLASAQAAENVCVWSNTATKAYKITATGNGASNAFTLGNGSNAAIPYSVSWANTTGATSGTSLVSGTASSSFTSAALLPACGGGASSTLLVGITAANQNTMVSDLSYTGTLTLLVAPV